MDLSETTRFLRLRRAKGSISEFCLFLVVVTSVACSVDGAKKSEPLADKPHSSAPQPTSVGTPAAAIRSIDFRNFTYPANPVYAHGSSTFTLVNGRYEGRREKESDGTPFGEPAPVSLVRVIYGDVTNDSEEEAIAILYKRVAGTAIPYYVYVFGLGNGKPKILWRFEAGDRGDGGLRRVYGQGGNLVVELYGKNTTPEDIVDKDSDSPACCPTFFTRIHYIWNVSRFDQSGELEIIPNPRKNAALVLDEDASGQPD